MSYDYNRLSTQSFIEKAIKKHGNKYDYSLCDYKHSRIPITIICKKCKKAFNQTPSCHLCGNNCPFCNRKNQTITQEEFIQLSKQIHGDLYDYSKSIYTHNRVKVSIYCKKCKKFFNQQPRSHIYGKSGCPQCKHSRGESKIANLLKFLNIDYIAQHKFNDCKSSRNYIIKFDFYIPLFNTCIEFDGEQHFDKTNKWHNEYTEDNDRIKNKYCQEHNIKMRRISYKEFDSIENIVKSLIFSQDT